jgi:hypothetical protein
MTNGVIGGLTTLLVFAATRIPWGDDEEETFDNWVLKNKWAKKYVVAALPLAYGAWINTKDKKLAQWIERTFFLDTKYVQMGEQIHSILAKEGYKGKALSNAEVNGIIGQVFGNELVQLPIGWRVARDAKDVYKGAILGEDKVYPDAPTSFLEGVLWGGALQEFGAMDKLKEEGVFVQDYASIKGIGISADEALKNVSGFQELDRQQQRDFLESELKLLLLGKFRGYTAAEREEFLDRYEVPLMEIFPEIAKYPKEDRKRELGALASTVTPHKLRKLDKEGKEVDIFQSDEAIDALIDIIK